jgi:hypothetical protein
MNKLWLICLICHYKNMYIVGLGLFLTGFLLCLSIAWAAIGFLAMGFGLICVLIAEERKKSSRLRLEPPPAQPPLQARSFLSALPTANTEARQDRTTSEKQEWRLQVENDRDLAKVERVLSQYGSQYVDQLATVYAVFNNKAFLPVILKMIVASAKLNAEGERGSEGYFFDKIVDDGRQLADEIAAGDLQPHDPEVPAPQQQTEIILREAEAGPEGHLNLAPAPLDTGIPGGVQPPSHPAADPDETDVLMRLFDKLMSSRR